MKKRAASPPASSRGSYAGKGVSSDVKEHTAELTKALLDEGVEMSTIVSSLKKTRYAPSQRTLYRHVERIKSGEDVLSAEKKTGREAALTEEEKWVVAGWILAQEKKVDLWMAKQWIRANMGVIVDISTVSRWKDALGLSVQLTGKRPMSEGMTKDEYVLGYFEFCQRLQRSGFWDYPKHKILCLDSVTNSMRADREKTLHLKGGAQKKLARNVPKYTNNYLVCVAMEGGEDYDALMFTYDPCFDPNGPRWKEVKKWCNNLGINTDQIFYQKHKKKYCAEQAWQIAQFKNRYRRQLAGTRVLHDGGPAYKLNGSYILEDGADRLEVLPSEQHGRLSPLDNKLNAVAKALWRADRTMKDFSYDALLLLSKLEQVGQDDITTWWHQNFVLDVPELTLKAVDERLKEVKKKPPVRQHLADMYEEAYDSWLEDHSEMPLQEPPEELKDGMDGVYWK